MIHRIYVEKIKLFDDSITALKYLADNDFAIVLITNQAGIAEGIIDEEEFWVIQEVILNRISSSGIKVLKTYMNSESATSNVSEWRKPGPKMLIQAAEDLKLELSEIYMVGDRQSDVQAGINAGCRGGILVKTANENEESPNAIYIALNLLDAVHYVVANS